MTPADTKKTEFETWERCLLWLGAIIAIQTIAVWLPWLTLLTTIPLIGLLYPGVDSTGQPMSDPCRPQRIYLACLLIGVTSIVGEVSGVSAAIAESLASESTAHPLLAVVQILPRLAARVIIPGAVGIVGYTVLMHIGPQEEQTTVAAPDWIARLGSFLEDNNAPVELNEFLQTLTSRLEAAGDQYASLAQHAETAGTGLNQVKTNCNDFSATIQQFAAEIKTSVTELQQLRAQLTGAQAEMGQIESQVGEMGAVLDQFTEVASHQVLQYQPTDSLS